MDVTHILLVCNNRGLKTYVLILASGGKRAVEALAIRIKDIDYSDNPTKIHIRKEYAKTRVARDIYISDEATQYLKSWIDWKYGNSRQKTEDDLVFGVGRSKDPRSLYTEIADEFAKFLQTAYKHVQFFICNCLHNFNVDPLVARVTTVIMLVLGCLHYSY